jgi:acetyl esterase
MRNLGQAIDLPIGELAIIKDIEVPGTDGNMIRTRLFDARASRDKAPVMLYFHGGGFVFGDLDTHAPVCAEIARQMDLPVLAVDYRLAPEHKWPAAQDDCKSVSDWLSSGAQTLGFAPSGVLYCGDSAGGWLSIVVALHSLEMKSPLPILAIGLIYPLIDMNCARYASFEECGSGYTLTADGMNWFLECFAPDLSDPNSNLSSVVRAELPPTVVIAASLDPLRDQGPVFASALAKAGGTSIYLEAKGQVHGFIGSRGAIPSSRNDLDAFLTMLKAAIKTNSPDQPIRSEPQPEPVATVQSSSAMERGGFFWIRFISPQGQEFEPLVAWHNRNGWRIPGSAEQVPENVTVEILDGPIVPPAMPAES